MGDSADRNVCLSCGWEQSGVTLNPHLRKCPNCGAPFSNRNTERVFVHPRGRRNGQSQDTETDQ